VVDLNLSGLAVEVFLLQVLKVLLDRLQVGLYSKFGTCAGNRDNSSFASSSWYTASDLSYAAIIAISS
jgi:hypothetical protein